MNIKTIEETFENRKKISKEVKNSIITSLIFNIIMFIIMIAITLIINISFSKLSTVDFDNYITVVQVAIAIMVIALYEVAYRKDSLKIGLYGIEFSVFSIAVLYVPYMYIMKNNTGLLTTTVVAFSIYYFSKTLVTFLLERYKYLKENMSDVKEIVKDEKKGYIDEESQKTLKERKQKEEEMKKKKTEKINKKVVNSKNVKTKK